MRVCCLASGSKGNCTFVESKNCKILIDIGISCKDVETRLASIGVDASEINAILVTHEHSDHIGGLKTFISKYKVPFYAHISGIKAIVEKQDVASEFQISFMDNPFTIEDMLISPFRLSHDSVCCVGYSVQSDGKRMSIMTDTGVFPEGALEVMSGSDIIVIESNYNKKMLADNPNYSLFLKNRIRSVRGHLSNEECAISIAKLLNKAYTTQFVLAHLSENNNTPIVAFQEVTGKLRELGIEEGKDIFIDIAMQHTVGHQFMIEDKF